MNDKVICIQGEGRSLTKDAIYEVQGFFNPNTEFTCLVHDNRLDSGSQEWFTKRFKLITDDTYRNNCKQITDLFQELYDDPIQKSPQQGEGVGNNTPTTK